MDFTNISDMLADVGPMIKEVKPEPGLTLHVDGDYLAYYAAGNDDQTPQGSRLAALKIIREAMTNSGATDCVVHNTASGANKGERYIIATVKPYQAQRDPGRKPKNYYHLREWLMSYDGERFKSKTWVNREADDGIGACALYALKGSPGYAAIMTRDKDLRMLPGLHVEWLTRDTVMVPPGSYEVSWKPERWEAGTEKVYGLKWFWLQMLMGDTADHIPGLEGYLTTNGKGKAMFKPMGEKTAEAFLAEATNTDEAYEVVARLYRDFYDAKGGNWADRLVEQAALLWMRTDGPASVGDFARHGGASCISRAFCDETWAAVDRLERRVKETREQADALAS